MVLIRRHPKSSPATFTSPWKPFTKPSITLLETEHSLSKSGTRRPPTSGHAALIGLGGDKDSMLASLTACHMAATMPRCHERGRLRAAPRL